MESRHLKLYYVFLIQDIVVKFPFYFLLLLLHYFSHISPLLIQTMKVEKRKRKNEIVIYNYIDLKYNQFGIIFQLQQQRVYFSIKIKSLANKFSFFPVNV